MKSENTAKKFLFISTGEFDNYGGWSLDTQFIQNMGVVLSAYPRVRQTGCGRSQKNYCKRTRHIQSVGIYKRLGGALETGRVSGLV